MCKHVHPYLLQCKGIYMDYCLSFVAIILVWYSHLFCVIIWYVFNHYVNGKEFLKNWIYIDFTLPPSHHPNTPHPLKHTHTHTHSLHSSTRNCKWFWPVNHFTMLLHDCSFSHGHIRSHVCVNGLVCIYLWCVY